MWMTWLIVTFFHGIYQRSGCGSWLSVRFQHWWIVERARSKLERIGGFLVRCWKGWSDQVVCCLHHESEPLQAGIPSCLIHPVLYPCSQLLVRAHLYFVSSGLPTGRNYGLPLLYCFEVCKKKSINERNNLQIYETVNAFSEIFRHLQKERQWFCI